MFYKKINDNWSYGSEIFLPDGIKLSAENKTSMDGWNWFENPPREFILENHVVDFAKAFKEQKTVNEIIDIQTLIISDFVLENRKLKTYGVAFYLDSNFYYMDNISYLGLLTESEISENLILQLNNF
jgi:hypothetical protein